MKKNLSDEQLDQILKRIVKDSLPNEQMVDDIADSPKLWWNVQSQIRREKPSRAKLWNPFRDWRIAALAWLILMFGLGFIWLLNSGGNDLTAEVRPIDDAPIFEKKEKEAITETPNIVGEETISESAEEKKPKAKTHKRTAKKSAVNIVSTNIKPKTKSELPKKESPTPEVAKNKEIKSDFIALAYSSAPESGQILKMKVPRSMMISLGVTSNVENASELVNAEVLMGDDGLARAIRFVQ